MGAYITNGEGGESDIRGEYPPYLAKIRREEAADVLAYLGGQVHFLNMPHIASARIQQELGNYGLPINSRRVLWSFFLNLGPT